MNGERGAAVTSERLGLQTSAFNRKRSVADTRLRTSRDVDETGRRFFA